MDYRARGFLPLPASSLLVLNLSGGLELLLDV